MPFEIVRNDIVEMRVDAIVNAANPRPVIGYGVDAAIHQKAGPKLLKARTKIGGIAVGHAAVTPGFGLDAKYVSMPLVPSGRAADIARSSCSGSAMSARWNWLGRISANP